MKREIVTVSVEVETDSRAATELLLVGVKAGLEARPPRVVLPDYGAARVRLITIGRIRPKSRKR